MTSLFFTHVIWSIVYRYTLLRAVFMLLWQHINMICLISLKDWTTEWWHQCSTKKLFLLILLFLQSFIFSVQLCITSASQAIFRYIFFSLCSCCGTFGAEVIWEAVTWRHCREVWGWQSSSRHGLSQELKSFSCLFLCDLKKIKHTILIVQTCQSRSCGFQWDFTAHTLYSVMWGLC